MADFLPDVIARIPLLNQRPKYNIYCDESCHLENDRASVMVLGALWCPLSATKDIAKEIRAIRKRHGLPPGFEIKWTKVGGQKVEFYAELVHYFLRRQDLCFRALVAKKEQLDHTRHGQTHDQWYYKMYFDMLKVLFSSACRYRIYLDIKDTCSGQKMAKLHEVLCRSQYDFDQQMVERVQVVRSHEIEQMQLADLLIGAVGYANRGLSGNPGKKYLLEILRQYCGASLTEKNSPYPEKKVNIFHWVGGLGRCGHE